MVGLLAGRVVVSWVTGRAIAGTERVWVVAGRSSHGGSGVVAGREQQEEVEGIEEVSERASEEEERSAGEREGEEGFLREAVVVRGTWGSKEKRKKEGRQGSRVPSPVVQVGNGRVQRSPPGQRGGPEGQCGWAWVGEGGRAGVDRPRLLRGHGPGAGCGAWCWVP